MDLKKVEGYAFVNGGVCAAKGFKASGVHCGLVADKNKNDVGIIVSDTVCNTACVYTQNKVKGAPIIVTQQNMKASGKKMKAVIVNSKNANTCNADGEQKAMQMCALLAEELGIEPEQVVVASTGVIGQVLNIKPIAEAVPTLVKKLSYTGNEDAATAIMTTDTVKKEVAVEFEAGGKICRLGGMAKGSGMIHPNMATTLNFITTDCKVSGEALQKALSEVTEVTYNCLSVDGDTSTNDMVCLMSNGVALNDEITPDSADFKTFKTALYAVMMNLTRMLAADGEGASRLVECNVTGAKDHETAKTLAKSVISSALFKCMIYGADSNWGRVLCAMGYSGAEFDIHGVSVSFSSKKGTITVCQNGGGVEFSEEKAKEILLEDEIIIDISVGDGDGKATAWGCDLTYDYVKINGDYRS